ncbi:MAG: hypothetical protein ACI9PY_002219 [Ascidiaceihabitans sp.]|jgi:hypothetical protein
MNIPMGAPVGRLAAGYSAYVVRRDRFWFFSLRCNAVCVDETVGVVRKNWMPNQTPQISGVTFKLSSFFRGSPMAIRHQKTTQVNVKFV